MSWFGSGSQQQNGSRSQREVSPQPLPCSPSQKSQSSASRALGRDITNRSPTPVPAPHPPLIKGTATRASPATPLTTSTATVMEVLDTARERETDTSSYETVRFEVPSHDTFYGALVTARWQRHSSLSPQQQPRRRSRSAGATLSSEFAEWYPSAVASERDWDRWAEDDHAHDTDGDALPHRNCDESQPSKRPRLQKGEASCADASVILQLSSPASTEGGVVEEEGPTRSIFLDVGSPSKRGSTTGSTDGGGSSAFFTPISTNLLLLSGTASGKRTRGPSSSMTTQAPLQGSESPVLYREERQGDTPYLLRTPSPPLASRLYAPPRAQSLPSQHLCLPASMLDTTPPSWQVLAAATASTAAGPQAELLATMKRGERRMRLVSAVDSTVVYSPSSLEDISPIPCLSEDRGKAMRAGGRHRTSSHFCDEEAQQQGKETSHGSEEDSSMTFLPLNPLFSRTRAIKEEEEEEREFTVNGTNETQAETPYLRDDVLNAASEALDELHCSLMCWQR